MSQDHRRATLNYQNFVLTVLLLILLGYLLWVGQGVLVPIFVAVISVYVLASAAEALGRLRLGGRMPMWLRRAVVLLLFAGAVAGLVGLVVVTIDQMVAKAPVYQANLDKVVTRLVDAFGMESNPDWQTIRRLTIGEIDIRSLLRGALSSGAGMLGFSVLIVVYAAFLLTEREAFAGKLKVAFPHGDQAEQTDRMIDKINEKIGEYLAVKTLVNVILAVLSFAIMWACGVDFAAFWALMIGLLNYIPYVGSLLAVVFPVLITLAQYGSVEWMLIVAALLTVPQLWVGNVLEPRMMGHRLNLSPFVVLVSLSVWSSLWGIAGAILAIPLTSVFVILLAAFPSGRPIALMLSDDVRAFVEDLEEIGK